MYKSKNSKGTVNILGAFKVILVIALLGGGFLLFAHYVMEWDVLGFFQGFGGGIGGGGGASGGGARAGGTSADSDSGLGGMMPIILVVGIIALIIWRMSVKKKEDAAKGKEEGDMRTLEGVVIDYEKNPIANRSITIRFKPHGTFRWQQKAQTRDNGKFSVQLADNVTYDVEIEKNSYPHFSKAIKGETFTNINDPTIINKKRWGGPNIVKIRKSTKNWKFIILEEDQEAPENWEATEIEAPPRNNDNPNPEEENGGNGENGNDENDQGTDNELDGIDIEDGNEQNPDVRPRDHI